MGRHRTPDLSRPDERTPRRLVAAAVLAVVAFSVGCSGGSLQSSAEKQSGGTDSASNGSSGSKPPHCSMPLTHDTVSGFHIAVPKGWSLSTLGGLIEVAKDRQGKEGVVVYPALKKGSTSAKSFFSSNLERLSLQDSSGHPVKVTHQSESNGEPIATFTGSDGGTSVQGEATVSELPLKTSGASSELVFSAHWAPKSTGSSDGKELAAIAGCYGPEHASLFRVHKDQAYTYITAPHWKVTDEGQNNIDLAKGNDADVSYLLASAIPGGQVSSAQDLVDYVLQQDGFDDVKSVSVVKPADSSGQNGNQSVEYEEFTGTFKGEKVHGLIYGEASVGTVTSGVVRLGFAEADKWNSLNSGMIQMMGAVQHDFTQDQQQIQQAQRQFDQLGKQVSEFDDTLNNQQFTQDPHTGDFYEAPYSAYQQDGPHGPGYYLDDGTKLNEVKH